MLGQKGFGRETYLCTPRGTPGGIEGNYPYVVGGTLFEAIGQLIARSGHCFAVHHLASTRGGADKYTIPRSVRNRVPANARAQPYIFSAIYRCGDNRAIRLGQKSFGRETYFFAPRGTPGAIEGNYTYEIGRASWWDRGGTYG